MLKKKKTYCIIEKKMKTIIKETSFAYQSKRGFSCILGMRKKSKVTLFFSVFFHVVFDRFERLFADVVFDAAGVFRRRLFVDADIHEKLTEEQMAFVNDFRPLFSRVGKCEKSLPVHIDKPVLFEQTDRAADGRF